MPFFKHEGMKIYYETIGTGQPLLIINGLSGDTRGLEPLANNLKKFFKVIYYDMRCAGRSYKPEVAFTISDLAEEARLLIRYLGYKKVHVLGFSMGGMVAMNLAVGHPEIVDKLFLVSTTPSMKGPDGPTADTIATLKRTDVSVELLTKVYEIIFGPEYRKKVSAEDFIKFRMEDTMPQPADAYLRQLKACESFDFTDKAHEIKQPTYIIVGEEDKLIPPESSRWLNEHIKGSKLFMLQGVGHIVPLEAPEKLSEIVTHSVFF